MSANKYILHFPTCRVSTVTSFQFARQTLRSIRIVICKNSPLLQHLQRVLVPLRVHWMRSRPLALAYVFTLGCTREKATLERRATRPSARGKSRKIDRAPRTKFYLRGGRNKDVPGENVGAFERVVEREKERNRKRPRSCFSFARRGGEIVRRSRDVSIGTVERNR